MSYTRLNPESGTRTASQLGITATGASGFTLSVSDICIYGKVMMAKFAVKPTSAMSVVDYAVNVGSISGLASCYHAIVGSRYHGQVTTSGTVYLKVTASVAAGVSADATLVALLP